LNAEEKILITEIQKRNIHVFKSLFITYRSELIYYAEQYIFDVQECEDIVEELFIHLWHNSSTIEIKTSLKSYLYQSVRNRCFNYLKKFNISIKNIDIFYNEISETIDTIKEDESDLIEEKIRKAIESLPEQMSLIVKMKYLERKKQKEISHILSISENTIKTQLSRARKKLKKILADLHFN